jgi:hypothetical protein
MVGAAQRDLRREMAIGLQPGRLGRARKGELLWLSRLIATMEQIARPEVRAMPCDQLVLAAVRAQLARPARALPAGVSPFILN